MGSHNCQSFYATERAYIFKLTLSRIFFRLLRKCQRALAIVECQTARQIEKSFRIEKHYLENRIPQNNYVVIFEIRITVFTIILGCVRIRFVRNNSGVGRSIIVGARSHIFLFCVIKFFRNLLLSRHVNTSI